MPDKQAVVSLMVLLFSLLIPVFLYNFYRKTGFPLFEPGFSLFNPCIPVKFWQADRISYSRYKTLYRVLYFLFSGISIFPISVQGYRTGPWNTGNRTLLQDCIQYRMPSPGWDQFRCRRKKSPKGPGWRLMSAQPIETCFEALTRRLARWQDELN